MTVYLELAVPFPVTATYIPLTVMYIQAAVTAAVNQATGDMDVNWVIL